MNACRRRRKKWVCTRRARSLTLARPPHSVERGAQVLFMMIIGNQDHTVFIGIDLHLAIRVRAGLFVYHGAMCVTLEAKGKDNVCPDAAHARRARTPTFL